MTEAALAPNVFAAIEAAAIARLKAYFGETLKSVERLAGELDDKTFGRIRANAPSIFVTLAALRPTSASDPLVMDLQWGVYVIAKRQQTEQLTTGGAKATIGAYDMLRGALVALVDQPVEYGEGDRADAAKFDFLDVDNLFEETFRELGVFCYGARLETKRVRIAHPDDAPFADNITPFETFHGDMVQPGAPADARPPLPAADEDLPAGVQRIATDNVALEQPPAPPAPQGDD